jgi:hypothetical protein
MSAKQQGQPKVEKPEPAHQTTAPEAVQLGPELLPAGLGQARSLQGVPDHGTARPLRQASLLRLQKRLGNAHVQRLLSSSDLAGLAADRQPAAGSASTPESQPATTKPAPAAPTAANNPPVQTKLQVNEPGDAYEQEADRVAETVMQMPVASPSVPPDGDDDKPSLPGAAPAASIQRAGSGMAEVRPELASQIDSLKGKGVPLPDSERTFFEGRLGADLSQVRLHTGPDAVQASRDLNARAFTTGPDIGFNEGEYQPGSAGGRKLLAHELTHVIQQGAAGEVRRKPGEGETALPGARHNGRVIQRKGGPGGDKAPTSPGEDPAFKKVVSKVKQTAKEQKRHEPAGQKAKEAQAAAVAPEVEKQGKAQNQKATEIESAAAAQEAKAAGGEAPGFDKEAFKGAIKAKIEALTPQDPKKMEDIEGSGVMDKVEQDVKGNVQKGKQEAQGNVDDKLAEQPEKGAVPDKEVEPLQPNEPGPAPADINASGAAPKTKGQSEVEQPLSEDSKALDQQMVDADVTEEQLEKSNEPEFQDAVASKRESQEHAQQAPENYRTGEQAKVGNAQGNAQAVQESKTQEMAGVRAATAGNLDTLQAAAKGSDEAKRQEIGQKINTIYDATKKDVDGILKKLDSDVDKTFNDGAKRAAATATAYVKKETKAYKDKRYKGDGGIGDRIVGGVRWLGDELVDMPAEYYEIFKAGRDLYIGDMDGVLDQVGDIVGTALTKAKTRIQQGRQEITDFVASQPQELRQIAEGEAGKIQGKFDALEQSVDAKESELVDSLAEKYNESLKELDNQLEAMKEEDKGLWTKAKEQVGGALDTIKQMKEMLLGVLAQAADAIDKIIKDPIGFLGNLIGAVKQGLQNFVSNIGAHLKKGLMGWLFGEVAKSGIQLPATFDLKGILTLALQLLGVTWANLRGRAVKMFGEKVVGALEKGFEIFMIVREQGIGGLWQYVKDKLTDLKEMVIGGIKDMVITEVIKAGIQWLIGVLGGPAGAFIKACKAIVDIVMWFINNASRLASLVQSIVGSVAAIAAGNIGGAAKFIENSLGQAIPIVIGFLASLLGLGSLGQKIRGIIQKVQEPINKAIDWVLQKAKAAVKKLGKALGIGKEKEAAGLDPQANAKARQLAREKVTKATERPFKDEKALKGTVKQIETELIPEGLKSLQVAPKEGKPGQYDIVARSTEGVGEAQVGDEEVDTSPVQEAAEIISETPASELPSAVSLKSLDPDIGSTLESFWRQQIALRPDKKSTYEGYIDNVKNENRPSPTQAEMEMAFLRGTYSEIGESRLEVPFMRGREVQGRPKGHTRPDILDPTGGSVEVKRYLIKNKSGLISRLRKQINDRYEGLPYDRRKKQGIIVDLRGQGQLTDDQIATLRQEIASATQLPVENIDVVIW